MAETCPTCGGVGKVFRTTAAGTRVVACPECGFPIGISLARCRELETVLAASQAKVERLHAQLAEALDALEYYGGTKKNMLKFLSYSPAARVLHRHRAAIDAARKE